MRRAMRGQEPLTVAELGCSDLPRRRRRPPQNRSFQSALFSGGKESVRYFGRQSGTKSREKGRSRTALDGTLQFPGKRPVPALTPTGGSANPTVRYPAHMIGLRKQKGAEHVPFISSAGNLLSHGFIQYFNHTKYCTYTPE